MKYRVIRIDEDLDFGCEERNEDSPVMAVVTLTDADGQEIVRRFPDQGLYERNIERGDLVEIVDGMLEKAQAHRTGLVLEGGAMRGMFTAGVLDVLMENGITFDGAIGVSAGATFGCNIKSGQIGRAIRYNKRFCGDKRYASVTSWLKTGDLFNVDFCYRVLPKELDVFDAESFARNPMEFWVVATDAETGGPIYQKLSDGGDRDVEWMRASASMPMLSRVVDIDDHKLLDGGVADSIPIRKMESLGYDRNVVVLTQPLEYRKEKNKYLPLAKVMLKKYPKMIEAIADRHIRYNETCRYIRGEEELGNLFVVRPPEALNIHSTNKDPEELERVYQIGRRTMTARLEELKKYLEGNSGT